MSSFHMSIQHVLQVWSCTDAGLLTDRWWKWPKTEALIDRQPREQACRQGRSRTEWQKLQALYKEIYPRSKRTGSLALSIGKPCVITHLLRCKSSPTQHIQHCDVFPTYSLWWRSNFCRWCTLFLFIHLYESRCSDPVGFQNKLPLLWSVV